MHKKVTRPGKLTKSVTPFLDITNLKLRIQIWGVFVNTNSNNDVFDQKS